MNANITLTNSSLDFAMPRFSEPAASFTFSTTRGLILAISLYACYVLFVFVYRLYFSPLAALPGPWYAAVSDFWITTHVVRMRQCRAVHDLFDRFGPVVRIGPTKVVFCDVTTMRNVYCVHKFEKSSYYKSVQTNNHDHAMTTLPNSEHAIRRKAYSLHYTMSNLALFQPDLHDYCLKVLEILDRISAKTSVDCLDLFRHLMVDVIACTVFGSRSGSLDNWAMNIHDPLSIAVYDFPKRGIMRSVVPTWAWNLICRIPSARWRELCNSDNIMAEFVGARLYELRSSMQAGKTSTDADSERIPLLQRMLLHRVFSTQEGMCDQDIISEAMGHLVAGVDTSSTLLSYLLWELSRRPDISRRLQAEIDEAMPDRRVMPDASVLVSLPYLNAFIKEGLRLYGPAPSLLERVVPPRSPSAISKADQDFDMMGYALPPGTIVSTQAWSVHRNTELFPSPETFLPERWLPIDGSDTEAERLARMSQHMMPFGAGTRICGGQNLAQITLRIIVAGVSRNFTISALSSETNERTMEMHDAFVLHPAAKECKLTFIPRAL